MKPSLRFSTRLLHLKSQALAFGTSLLKSYPLQITAYFLLLGTIGGSIIQALEPDKDDRLTNGFFLAFSTVTCTAFSPWETGSLSQGTYAVICVLMLLGGPVLHSLFPVLIRLFFAERQTSRVARRQNMEYRGLLALLKIVVSYHVLLHGIGLLSLGAWAATNQRAQEILAERNQTVGFWAVFHTLSAFNNVGISSLTENLRPFNDEPFPLLVLIFLALMGNTLFPVVMRVIVFALYRLSPLAHKPTFKFLLDNPRRCFTHLFLRYQTRWLFLTLLVSNLLQFFFFVGASWHSPGVAGMSPGDTIMNGLFASVVTRTAGFEAVVLVELPFSVLTLYLGMMYISTAPVAVSMRVSDLSQTHSSEAEDQGGKRKHSSMQAFTSLLHRKAKSRGHSGSSHLLDENSLRMAAQQVNLSGESPLEFQLPSDSLRKQAEDLLTQHALILFIVMVIIAALETNQFGTNPAFTPFRVIFEVISAYGNVGLSLKEEGLGHSFSGLWTAWSKAFLVLVMFLGRMRNLPRSIDPVFVAANPPGNSELTSPNDSQLQGEGPSSPPRLWDIPE